MRAIEQCDPVEEGHLAQLLDLFANLHLYLNLHFRRLPVGATRLLVLPVTAYGAGPSLPPCAFLRFMALLPATEAFDLAWVAVHEDRQFYRSVGARDEW